VHIMSRVFLLLVIATFCCGASLGNDPLESYSFDQYRIDFKKATSDTSDYQLRKSIFEKRVRKVILHNSDPVRTWNLTVNKFTDRTEDELKAMRGGRYAPREIKNYEKPKPEVSKFDTHAPINIDWRTKGVITNVKNQGMCGSCWTFGAAETLESYWALAGNPLTVLSEQQILDCTPNPNGCGGTGGCEGGTVELAYARIIVMGGLSTEQNYPYQGIDEKCENNLLKPYANMTAFVNLPPNKLQPMLNHIANNGPIAISVDASTWSNYGGGVFDGCNQKNPDLDHAVQLVGAGTDPSLGDYWLVRNSWGADWGESGYIRLRRTSEPRCGIDTSPQDGDGCNNGPKTVVVCGTCGILYDGVFPVVQKA